MKSLPLADTNFIIALFSNTDSRHRDVLPVYKKMEKIIVIQSVLNEVAYMLGRDRGTLAVAIFLKEISNSPKWILTPLEKEDILRTAQILEQYFDSGIDFVDASIMAFAERIKTNIILTMDLRDFYIFSPVHCDSYEIFP